MKRSKAFRLFSGMPSSGMRSSGMRAPGMMPLVAIFLVSSAASSVVLYRQLQRQDCGLQARQARAMVVEDLRERGLPVQDLVGTDAGPCRYTFAYGDEARYAVGNDWLRGVTVVRLEREGHR
ncbi:MAG: hypothetical protein ACOY82_09525 [Pseudomonadota bacterium]